MGIKTCPDSDNAFLKRIQFQALLVQRLLDRLTAIENRLSYLAASVFDVLLGLVQKWVDFV